MARRPGPSLPPVPRSARPSARPTPAKTPLAPLIPADGPLFPALDPDGRRHGHDDGVGNDRIGDPTVTSAELRRMGNLVATRHLLALLARRRSDLPRDAVIDEVAELLLGLNEGPHARRLLLQMAEVGRIVDIYPLEVMVRVMDKAPGALPRVQFGPVILNADEVQPKCWPVGEVVPLKVPLNMRLKAFALEGGGTPGYALAPGPPAAYALEVHAAGAFRLLFRGEVRKVSLIDRLTVRIEDPPEPVR